MTLVLKGAEVTSAMNGRMASEAAELGKQGIIPTLAILRVGERADDLSYEKNAMKRCAAVGVRVTTHVLPENVRQQELMSLLRRLNSDDAVHGIMYFRPLPPQLDEEELRQQLAPEKDVDGVTDVSLAGVFSGVQRGFAPCTAQACMEILDHYGIDCAGKRAVVIGRSLVAGKPAAMMLTARNATVTLCHSKTPDIPTLCRDADIVIAAVGNAESIGREHFSENQVVIDVGINWSEEKGRLCGDVRFDEAGGIVGAITPVPGGVGAVTTGVLVSHVVEAAKRSLSKI